MIWQVEKIDNNAAPTIGASQTNLPISYEAPVGASPLVQRIDIVVASATVAAGITFKLQQFDGNAWVDVKSDATLVTTASVVVKTIKLNPITDAALLPLAERIRVVVTSGAGDSAAVSEIRQARVK